MSALLSLSSWLSKRFGCLVVAALLSSVIVLLFECGRALGLAALVSNSISLTVIGMLNLPSTFVRKDLSYVKGFHNMWSSLYLNCSFIS